MCDVFMLPIYFNIKCFLILFKNLYFLSLIGSNSGHRSNNRIQYREIQDIQVAVSLIFSLLTVIINVHQLDLDHTFSIM